ncbi:hypothetical protein FCL47_17065 [Desulfopila sp. IMCC35006]|uniref:hypothetical protein n=1 Tax=Desulfopila sp. IMCC35006 TaxID=2569542 RepID=UPI0010ACE918|nr:hypothetical protein [Desulfopila sp. IMCC35006]TKB24551.1 hypothetical protein FCL47_17065 [Desulfopila sp. IMCC35006]
MNEEEKKARREKLRKGIKVSRIAHKIVMSSFDEINDFNDFMKSAIKREQDLTSKRLEKGASGLEGEELDRYWDFFAEDYQKIGSVFEKLALDSFVVMLYSRVETGMATLCDALRQDRQKDKGEKIGLRYSDLRGSGYLDQARLYIEKVLGIDLDLGSNTQWLEINALKALRNTIVHEEGWINTKNTRFKNYIKRGFIELRNQNEENDQISGRVIISAAYIDYILPQIRTFFLNIKI